MIDAIYLQSWLVQAWPGRASISACLCWPALGSALAVARASTSSRLLGILEDQYAEMAVSSEDRGHARKILS